MNYTISLTNLSFKLNKPMRKLSSLLMMLMMVGLTTVSAQKSKVTTGALNFDQGRYDEAIQALEVGLSDPAQFKKAKDLAKGYYYLSKSYYMILGDSTMDDKYPDAILRSKAAHDQLLATGEAGKTWQNRAKLDAAESNLWAQLYNKGVNLFNNNEDDAALIHFVAAQELNPDHFLTNRMLASAYLVKEDTAKTVELLAKSLDVYRETYIDTDPEVLATNMQEESFAQMAELDKSQVSYVVRQLAVIHEKLGNTDDALATLATGAEILPKDEDISRQELSIYQSHPELYEQAVGKFKSQLETNPEDNAVRLAFASMLERNGKTQEALDLYQDAYELDPENLQANYGLAAMRINLAAELSEAKMESNDDDEIEELNGQIKTLCEEAYPFLVWLHEEQPTEPEWLSQLVNITPIIGKTDEMMKWAEKLGTIRRGE